MRMLWFGVGNIDIGSKRTDQLDIQIKLYIFSKQPKRWTAKEKAPMSETYYQKGKTIGN
jgi:hypothetical protein